MNTIKLYLAEDHVMFRKALLNMIKLFPLLCDIREAENGRQLLNMVERDIPDVVIINLDMPVKSGYKTVKRLKQNYPEVKVIGFTFNDYPDDVHHAMTSGTDALISKNMMPENLARRSAPLLLDGDFITKRYRVRRTKRRMHWWKKSVITQSRSN